MEWMILPLKRYFDFRGRSRRMEYWMYWQFYVLLMMLLSLIETAILLPEALTGLFILGTLIPGTAVAVRRVLVAV